MRSFALVVAAVSALSAMASADPYADLGRVQKAFYAVHSFRGQISSPKMKQPITLEFVAPDRWHMVTPAGDQYIVGNTMTVHVGGMSMKLPMKAFGPMLQNIRTFAAGEDLKKDFTIQYAGTTNIGGQILRMYTYTKNSDPSVRAKMYIGPDNLPRRNEVTDKSGNVTTVTYKDYNSPITINP